MVRRRRGVRRRAGGPGSGVPIPAGPVPGNRTRRRQPRRSRQGTAAETQRRRRTGRAGQGVRRPDPSTRGVGCAPRQPQHRRNTLTVDDLIPVGDSFDYIVEGSEPIDSHAGAMFKASHDLYQNRLLPSLLEKHSVSKEQLATDPDSVPGGFRAQERIAKTLLLSAIAPNVPALRDITAPRLAALNHGSIKTRIAGG